MARDREKTKKKILTVSKKLFADKGFEGARVDDIAKKARINKALIYYYFKNKKTILSELMKNFFNETKTKFKGYIGEYKALSAVVDVENLALENKLSTLLTKELISFLEKKRDILRIIVAESLKQKSKKNALFKLFEFTAEEEVTASLGKQKKHGPNSEKQGMLVNEFFTNIIPLVNYVIFMKSWCGCYNVDEEEFKQLFLKAFKATHQAYHRDQGN